MGISRRIKEKIVWRKVKNDKPGFTPVTCLHQNNVRACGQTLSCYILYSVVKTTTTTQNALF